LRNSSRLHYPRRRIFLAAETRTAPLLLIKPSLASISGPWSGPQGIRKQGLGTVNQPPLAAFGFIFLAGAPPDCDPLRYWFPQREAVWKEHFLYDILEEQRLKLNLPFESLTQRKRKMGETEDFLRRPQFEPEDEDEEVR
jgi:hypothetical protein